jgi:hypothetical protein
LVLVLVLVLRVFLEVRIVVDEHAEEENTGGDGMERKLDTLDRQSCAHHGHDRCYLPPVLDHRKRQGQQ